MIEPIETEDILPKKNAKKRAEKLEAQLRNQTRFPLRITAKEWEKNFSGYDSGFDTISYRYDLFTLTAYLEWTGNVESGGWDYQDVYQVTCPYGRPQKVTFGPHKTEGLAKKKALDYLVRHGAVEIISK